MSALCLIAPLLLALGAVALEPKGQEGHIIHEHFATAEKEVNKTKFHKVMSPAPSDEPSDEAVLGAEICLLKLICDRYVEQTVPDGSGAQAEAAAGNVQPAAVVTGSVEAVRKANGNLANLRGALGIKMQAMKKEQARKQLLKQRRAQWQKHCRIMQDAIVKFSDTKVNPSLSKAYELAEAELDQAIKANLVDTDTVLEEALSPMIDKAKQRQKARSDVCWWSCNAQLPPPESREACLSRHLECAAFMVSAHSKDDCGIK